MTNVYGTPEKVSLKRRLFDIGIEVLKSEGYKVERAPGGSSIRRIIKDGQNKLISIRTSQDQFIAFPRKKDGKWRTLADIDMVVAVSVDDVEAPRYGWVYFLDGDDMRERFNRTYAARKEAGLKIPAGRGVWLSLFKPESTDRPRRVGAGAGLVYPRIATVPLDATDQNARPQGQTAGQSKGLTIAEAKRLLAQSLGVSESSIRISVEA